MFWSLLHFFSVLTPRGSMRRRLQSTEAAQVLQLIQDGTSIRAVARRSLRTVSRAWRRYQEIGQYTEMWRGQYEGQQPSSRTATSFVQGGTGGALPEPCKLTSSRPIICMFLLKLSDSMSVVWGPNVHKWGLCLHPNTVKGDWHLSENTKNSRFAIYALWSSRMKAGSHWAHVTDVTESGDAVEYVLLSATSSSMTGLAVGQ